jgi:hypothetical protein
LNNLWGGAVTFAKLGMCYGAKAINRSSAVRLQYSQSPDLMRI